MQTKNHAIILAAGESKRMASKKDKILLPIHEKPLIYYTITAFNDHPDINSITIVVSKSNKKAIEEVVKKYNFSKAKKIILGGETRQKSLEKGLKSLETSAKPKPSDIILVHNGANPLPSQEEITESIEKTIEHGACIVGHPVTATIKEISKSKVVKTHDRSKLFAAETPQTTTFKTLKKALEYAKKHDLEATDEAMLLEAINQPVTHITAHENNFKITTDADYKKLCQILGELPKNIRTGIGQDSHEFETSTDPKSKEPLTLAGLEFPEYPKLKADSDGDVILHAIFNALSQAIGDHSLGFYATPMFQKGIKDSKKYLEVILKKVAQKKLKINTLGVMLECKVPKIDPITSKLKKSLAALLNITPAKIGITATTGENLTSFGQGKGIQCFAIVSLSEK